MTKTKPVIITELNQMEVKRLLSDTVYSRFSASKCYQCEVKKGFDRRIFRINGIQKSQYTDDDTQNRLRYYFFHQYKIEYIFFRTHAGKFYADSASCQACQSMNVVFDVTLDDKLMAEYAKMVRENAALARARVEAMEKWESGE